MKTWTPKQWVKKRSDYGVEEEQPEEEKNEEAAVDNSMTKLLLYEQSF